jgi:uncharacterized DUF497 family protein
LAGVTFEWDARKTSANLKKHRVAFEDATTVSLDPLAITFADPDHSLDERREITIGYTMKRLFRTANAANEFGSLARALRREPSEDSMKK